MDLVATTTSRRNFIKIGSAVSAGILFAPKLIFAAKPAIIAKNEKRLILFNPNTGDHFNEVIWAEGKYVPEALKSLDHILRDRYTNEVIEINRKLIEVMQTLYNKFSPKQPFNVFCGYRSKKTNEMYRAKKKGIAKNSKHLTGDAVDFNIPNVRLRDLQKAAIQLKVGGVGYYPSSGFVHMDIRDKLAKW